MLSLNNRSPTLSLLYRYHMGTACSAESIHTDDCIHYRAYACKRTRSDSGKSSATPPCRAKVTGKPTRSAEMPPTSCHFQIPKRPFEQQQQREAFIGVAPLALMRCPLEPPTHRSQQCIAHSFNVSLVDESVPDLSSYSPSEMAIVSPALSIDAFE